MDQITSCCFSDAASDTNHERIKGSPIPIRKTAEGQQGIINNHCRRTRRFGIGSFADTADSPSGDGLMNKIMSVEAFAFQRPKQIARSNITRVNTDAFDRNFGGENRKQLTFGGPS